MVRPLHVTSEPPARKRHLTLVRLKAGQSMTVRICSNELFGYYSHYHRRLSHPCYGEECRCEEPLCQMKREWHGVLHCVDVQSQKDGLLEVTDTCARQLLDQVPNKRRLRGLRVTFERGKGGNNSRLKCTVDHFAALEHELPLEVDPLNTLNVLWAKSIALDLKVI